MQIHRRYNEEGITQYNIVPGLMGVVLTMTMVMMTGLAMTREQERGTMENLLAMPIRPLEVMLGKITPYIFVGYLQVSIITLAAHYLFDVPIVGSLPLLFGSAIFFIAANLSVGFTFSTLAKSQMQAMQLSFFFFLPSLLLSGFMFPFRGMPQWAQWIGEILPLTHFLRIIRGVMLKGNVPYEVWPNLWPIAAFMLAAMILAMLRYRRTVGSFSGINRGSMQGNSAIHCRPPIRRPAARSGNYRIGDFGCGRMLPDWPRQSAARPRVSPAPFPEPSACA